MPAGRPKNTPNKRSQMLLRKLEEEHKFFVAKELIEIYGYNKEVLVNLADKIHMNIVNNRSPLYNFVQNEIDLYNVTNKEVINILVRVLAYLYPKLKAMEVNQGTGDKIIINVSGMPDIEAYTKPKVDEEEVTVH